MAFICQNLERKEIEKETFKSFILDSVFFQILIFQCHLMPTFLMGIGLRGTGVSFALILVLAIVTWSR